jgi:hypothetical protein
MNFLEIKEGFLFRVRTSKAVRAVVYPYMNYKRKSNKKKYALTKDAIYIQSLKNTKKGKRCFILGNGPSLTVEDLNKLKREDTFAFNRIYYMFDKTEWRPTYYMCVDVGVLGMNLHTIESLDLPNIILSDIARKAVREQTDNIHYIYDYSRFKLNRWGFDQPYISENVSDHCCFCFTVTYDAIQLAIYMGYSEIYLLGVDHNYSVKTDSKGNIIKDESIKDYFEGLEKTAITVMNYEATTAAFETARKYCDEHGVIIRNATRGGKLEAFERVDFDTIVS